MPDAIVWTEAGVPLVAVTVQTPDGKVRQVSALDIVRMVEFDEMLTEWLDDAQPARAALDELTATTS